MELRLHGAALDLTKMSRRVLAKRLDPASSVDQTRALLSPQEGLPWAHQIMRAASAVVKELFKLWPSGTVVAYDGSEIDPSCRHSLAE